MFSVFLMSPQIQTLEVEYSVCYKGGVGGEEGTVYSQRLIACGLSDAQALGHPEPQESHLRDCVTLRKCRGRKNQLAASRGRANCGPQDSAGWHELKMFSKFSIFEKYPKEEE